MELFDLDLDLPPLALGQNLLRWPFSLHKKQRPSLRLRDLLSSLLEELLSLALYSLLPPLDRERLTHINNLRAYESLWRLLS